VELFTPDPDEALRLYSNFLDTLHKLHLHPRPSDNDCPKLSLSNIHHGRPFSYPLTPHHLIPLLTSIIHHQTDSSPQNTLFNTALKQSTSLQRDLATPPPYSTSLLGQISASLTSFSRTLDSYASLSKTELNSEKKSKAEQRLQTFRSELQSFREQFKELKLQSEEASALNNRTELLGRRPHNTGTPDNPYSNAAIASGPAVTNSPWAPKEGGSLSINSGDYTRETHALREQNFFANTHTALDEYLARGQAVLGDLGQQREILKGTQKRLYSVANTLGISGDTIRMIERRTKQDKWIFWAGVVIFFGFCWLVLHYLR
jgi:hypothetical protein